MKRFKRPLLIFLCTLLAIYLIAITYVPNDASINKYDFSEIASGSNRSNKYLKYGMQAFNGAPEISVLINHFKNKHNITIAVETGTYIGGTTALLANVFSKVYTIEIVEEHISKAKENLKDFTNIKYHLGSSPDMLQKLLPKLEGKNVLFYLDAHWQNYWPVLDELKLISQVYNKNTVIIIDDIKVPGRLDIDYDRFGSNELSLEHFNNTLKNNFKNYKIEYIIPKEYNSRAKMVISFE
ncbi:MAG: hypothetical protein K0Q51_1183 [Rickettsiaceae bacterium]|jgi:predicted O-methyltransferase YrrM|nr:hypothetical protein [Rickettsiaceae bacterium]